MKRIGNYFSGVFKELKKVKWPGGKELIKNIITTFAFGLFFCGFFYVIDLVFALLKGLLN